MTHLDLTGRTALVTGGAQGLGEGMAHALADAGAKVVVADIQDDLGAKVAESLGRGPRRSSTSTSPTTPRGRRRSPPPSSGSAASTSSSTTPASRSPACWSTSTPTQARTMLDINVVGTALGIKHAFRAMRPGGAAGNGGTVINIASVAATIAFPAISIYSATKSAVDRLTRVAAMESGKLGYGVRVNCIYPGLVPNEMGANLANDVAAARACSPRTEEAVGAVVGLTPLRPAGQHRGHRRRGGLPRLRQRPASSTASASRSTAAWACEPDPPSARDKEPDRMSSKPVVVYGASGYTGRLICEYLREYNVPVHRRRPRRGPS